MIGPAGWFYDPSGRPQLRYFDGWRWTDWVSTGGQVVPMPLTPPATGGGTLVTEPILLTTGSPTGSFQVTTQAGQLLASALDPDGQRRRLEVADPTGRVVLKLRRTGLGATATVAVRLDSSELGRFENHPSGLRALTRGSLAALVTVPAPDQGPAGIVDAAGIPLARIQRRSGTWMTELARPLGDPLHPLLALTALAIELLESA